MRLKVPDPSYASSPRSRRNFTLAFKLSFGFVVLIWAVFIFDQLLSLGLVRFGLIPGHAQGLIGVLTAPLLHLNLAHVGSNSLPLLVGGTAMLFLYPNSALRALPAIYAGSGLLAWTFARESVHIGASGLVYGMLAYVFMAGIFRRDLRSIATSVMIWFLYGSMVWGVLPTAPGTSWELHLTGALFGIVTAWLYRDWDLPPYKKYSWDLEDEEEPASWESNVDFGEDDGRERPWRR